MRNLLFILLTIFSFSFASAQNATLFMEDAYGDGWNGGSVTIEGVAYTVASGDDATEFITLADPTCVYATILAGSWEAEMTFTLTVDATGEVLLDYQTNGFAPGAPATATLDIQSANCATLGCMDVMATNYNVAATVDDGSCLFNQDYVDNNVGVDCTEFTDSIIVLNTLLDAEVAANLVLTNLNDQLNLDLTSVTANYDALLIDYNALVTTNDALQIDYDALLLDYNNLLFDFDVLTVENTTLTANNQALAIDNVNLNITIDGLNTTVTTLQNTNNDLVLNLAACQEDFINVSTVYNELINDFNVVSTDLVVANDSIVVLNGLLADCLDNDQVDCTGYEAQILLLEGQLVACSGGIDALNSEILSLGFIIDDLTDTNDGLVILNDALMDENVLLNADLVDCNQIYADLDLLYTTSVADLADCNDNYAITTLLNVDLTNTNVVLNDSIVVLNAELTDCLENGTDCSSQDMIIAELQGTIGAYQAEIDILTDTITALQAQLLTANSTIDELQYDIDFYLSTIEANEILIADLQQQLADCLNDDTSSLIDNGSTDTEKVLLFATNALGQRVDANTVGQIIILHYADGSSEKIIRDIR